MALHCFQHHEPGWRVLQAELEFPAGPQGHSMDEVSNGGAFGYGADSWNFQYNTSNLKAVNYGNSDYDIRHNFTGSFVWEPPHRFSSSVVNGVLGGWSFSGAIFARSGLPYTVLDTNAAFGNYGATYIPAQPLGGGGAFGSGSCGNPNNQCFDPNAF